MKKVTQIAIVPVIIILFFAFQNPSPPKSYNVSLPYQTWVKYSNAIQYTAERIRQSDLPAKEVSLITDSLLLPLYTIINRQVQTQVEEEKKGDSTKTKK